MRQWLCALLIIAFLTASILANQAGRAAPIPASCPTLPPHLRPASPMPMVTPVPTPAPTVEPHQSGASRPVRFRADVPDSGPFVQQAKLLASDNVPNPCHTMAGGQGFGQSIAISGDGQTLVVASGAREGSVLYIFDRGGLVWSEQAKIIDPSVTRTGIFERALAINGDGTMIVIGETDTNGHWGAAGVLVRNGATWSVDVTLAASDG